MKITKRQLKRIIREEKARSIRESGAEDYMSAKVAAANYLDRPSTETKTTNEWADFILSVIDTELYDMGSNAEFEGSNIGNALEVVRRQLKDKTSKKSYR
jgi:hypothetical protein